MKKDDVDRLIELRQADKVINNVQNVTSEVTPDVTHEVTGEVTGEVPCKTHPDAPHGFDRNASHSADRYVCECESWEPVEEPFIYIREDTEMPFGGYEHCGQHEPGAFPVYLAPPKRDSSSWVGLTDEEIYDYADKFLYQHGSNYGIKSFGKAIEARLKEKNS